MNAAWSWVKAHPRATAVAAGVATALLLGSYGAGRFMAPTKVETREVVKTVEVVKWRDREVVTKGPVKVVTRTVTVPGPEGPTVTVDRVVEREKVVTVHTQGADTVTTNEKIVEKLVERDAPRVTLAATIGAGFSSEGVTAPAYGVLALGRVAGPFVVGAQAEGNLSGGSARVIAGVTF
jgi:hypothetical protein